MGEPVNDAGRDRRVDDVDDPSTLHRDDPSTLPRDDPSTLPRDDPSTLHRDAVAIWRLLSDLEADDARTRAKLVQARFELRARSATMWRERGWTSITHDRRLGA